MIKKILSKLLPQKLKKILNNFAILAIDYGQYKAIKSGSCVDRSNNKIPWYTYPAIEYLNNIDFSSKSVLEYGCGNSSSFWSRRAKKVISVEHDKVWYEKMKALAESNQHLVYSPDCAGYETPSFIDNHKFEVIIIDANRRFECAQVLERYIDFSAEDGFMVILDNSDWFKNTARFIREKFDLIEVDFHGFGPINNYTWTTSVFFSRNFRFKPHNNIQPDFSIASLRNNCD